MSKQISQILKEATNGAIDNNVLTAIEEAVNAKVKAQSNLQIEKALLEQDELYTSKLKQLLEAIDKDHTKKLDQLVESIDKDRARKLISVVKKYERSLNEDAHAFQGELVKSVSQYLDAYLSETVPTESIQEAVKNKKAKTVLEGLRNHLAVDAALERDSVKEAVLDGKHQIHEASQKLESVQKQNTLLKEELNKVQSNVLLEQKTSKLDKRTAGYIKKMLNNKDPEFINENFDYTLNLFKKNEKNRLTSLKEEAYKDTTKVDVTRKVEEKVVEESTASPYLQELSKY